MPKVKVIERRVHEFKKADWSGLSDCIAEESWTCVEAGTVDEAVENFTSTLRSMIDEAIPQKTIRENKGSHPWVDGKVLAAVHDRNIAIGGEDEPAAVAKCSEVIFKARGAYQERMKTELASMTRGSKLWWKKSRELLVQRATTASIPALRRTSASEWCLTAKNKADLLAKTFEKKNVLAPAGDHACIYIDADYEEQLWDSSTVTTNTVERELLTLRLDSATGPDLIPTRVLKWCAASLSGPVHCLFERILQAGEWPALWIIHWIVPIYKRHAAWDPENYRGVHVTSQLQSHGEAHTEPD